MGFSLVELAIVLVIVSLLLGGMFISLGTQSEMRAAAEERKQTDDLIEALLGYAASRPGKPYLPCPDTDGDGVGNRNSANCTAYEGGVPWIDLGVGRVDAWDNRLRYRVTEAFAIDTGFGLATKGTLRVCRAQACAGPDILGSELPAVIVSYGRNGRGATSESGNVNGGPGASDVDELENLDNDNDFVAHPPTTAGSPGGEFDDVVVWLSGNILANRMIAAGRLP
ncbi:type II secretion system protein [Rhodocyclus tenuis]|uniref:type II secretion system protein n=1 Tax=Rhodocyclus tenuis TaxID=1066 RepID=UPI001A92A3C2|nr:type II secretion system protein [Rhodocyclus tenuis]MBK1680215.1 hypothetical protein [Rhodocyclus tenuis]